MTAADTRIKVYDSLASWADSTANWISQYIQYAIQERGRCTICFSGGKTPAAVYEKLASAPHLNAIAWEYLYGFWGDERSISPDRPDSNYSMVKEALLDKVPIPAANILRIKGELPPDQAAVAYENVLQDFFQVSSPAIPVIDLILLGVGNDGHIASIFPRSELIDETDKWVSATYVRRLNSWRVSMTPVILNHARQIAFLATGKRKAEVLDLIWRKTGNPTHVPAMIIRPDNGTLTWHVDHEAASIYQTNPLTK